MSSPARRHWDRHHAPQAAGMKNPAAESPAHVRGRLADYQARVEVALSAMVPMSVPDREETKRAALADILPFVDAYLSGTDVYPNSVAVQACIWSFDTGQIGQALAIGLALVKQGVHVTPRKFDRDLKTFIGDEMYDWAEEQLQKGERAAPYLNMLLNAIESEAWDLFPGVVSKNLVMAAKHAKAVSDWPAVVDFCQKALKVNPEKAGCKTLLNEAISRTMQSGDQKERIELV